MIKQLRDIVGPLYDVHPDFLGRYPEDDFGWDGGHPFIGQMVAECKPKLIIEVGTWKGQSAFNMINTAITHQLDTHLICVDTWLGSWEHWFDHKWQMGVVNGSPHVYEVFLANVIRRHLEDDITPVRVPGSVGAEMFARLGLKADLIYLDAAHLERDARCDIEAYLPLLNEGGVLFGHDYGDHCPGVKQAVQKFSFDSGIPYHTANGFWVLDT